MDNSDSMIENLNPLNLLSQKLSTSDSPLEDLSLQDSALALDDLCFPGEAENSTNSSTLSQFSAVNQQQTLNQNVTESRISPLGSPNGSFRSLDIEDGASGEDIFASNSLPLGGSMLAGNRMTRRTKEVAKFQCGDCSFVTSKLYVFNEHVATHKNNEKEHECPVCQQKFKYKQSVKKHMMKHQGITPYHCLICDYKTNSHSSLEVHQRAHSGEKPFVCKSCGMRFAQNSQLRVHIQYHSNANNPYKCELCDYQSPNYYKLTRHMKVHRERPYACDMCNKKFMLPYQLRNHIATHSKVTQSIASSSSTLLQVEEKTHRDLMTCTGCMTVYTNRENYLNHVKECPVMVEPSIIVEPTALPPYTSDLRSVNTIKARNTTFASMEAEKSSKKFAPIAPKKVSSSEKPEKVTSSSMLPVSCVTTEIRHADSTVSKILHIPPFKGWDGGSKPSPGSNNFAIKRPSGNTDDDISDMSSPSSKLSKAVNKLTFLSENNLSCETFEEHLGETQASPLINTKLVFPEDTVVINPEAVPMQSPLQNFNVEIPAPDFGSQFETHQANHSNISTGSFSIVSESSSKSEHSNSSPGISPPGVNGNNYPLKIESASYLEAEAHSRRQTKLAILEEQMGSIMDKLWLKFQTNSESSVFDPRTSKSPKSSSSLTPRQQMKHWFKENQSGFKALQDFISGDEGTDDEVLDLSQPTKIKTESVESSGVLECQALDLSNKSVLDLSGSSPLDLSIKEPPQLANAGHRKSEKPEYNRNSGMPASPVISANGRKNTFFGSGTEVNRVSKVSRVLSEDQAIIKTDNPERPFKCGYCGKQFIQSSHIRVHLQYHVNAGNPFRCSDCSYTSASKYKLNLHVKVHKERRFQCEHCSSKFTLNCRLNQHVKLAHGEHLPYKCAICNVTFSSTNLLSWHVVNKHPFAQNVTPEVLSSSIGDEKLEDDLAVSIEGIADSIQ